MGVGKKIQEAEFVDSNERLSLNQCWVVLIFFVELLVSIIRQDFRNWLGS
jgi:hypothetical protein